MRLVSTLTATRYNRTIHDFVLLNAIHDVPLTRAALRKVSDELTKYLKP
jgi:acetyl esterase